MGNKRETLNNILEKIEGLAPVLSVCSDIVQSLNMTHLLRFLLENGEYKIVAYQLSYMCFDELSFEIYDLGGGFFNSFIPDNDELKNFVKDIAFSLRCGMHVCDAVTRIKLFKEDHGYEL